MAENGVVLSHHIVQWWIYEENFDFHRHKPSLELKNDNSSTLSPHISAKSIDTRIPTPTFDPPLYALPLDDTSQSGWLNVVN